MKLNDEIEKNEKYFFDNFNKYGSIGIDYNLAKEGLEITAIEEKLSADKAGLLEGDIILKINNENLSNIRFHKELLKKGQMKLNETSVLYIQRKDEPNFKVNIIPLKRRSYETFLMQEIEGRTLFSI